MTERTAPPPMVIMWQDKDGLWNFQEQGHSGRQTWSGFATKQGAVAEAVGALGENVRVEFND